MVVINGIIGIDHEKNSPRKKRKEPLGDKIKIYQWGRLVDDKGR